MNKFELLDSDTKVIAPGRTVQRIRALVEIAALGVAPGDLGGYVESHNNLSAHGDAWVYGNAQVYGDAAKTPICISGFEWHITVTDSEMSIGCQTHSIEAWRHFKDDEILPMAEGALMFWRARKAAIFALIDARDGGAK